MTNPARLIKFRYFIINVMFTNQLIIANKKMLFNILFLINLILIYIGKFNEKIQFKDPKHVNSTHRHKIIQLTPPKAKVSETNYSSTTRLR